MVSPSPSMSAMSMSAETTSEVMARFMSIKTCLSSSRDTVPVLSSSMVRKALRIWVKRVSMWFLTILPARRISSSDLSGATREVGGRYAGGEREIFTRSSRDPLPEGALRRAARLGLRGGRGCAPGWAGAALGPQ